MIPALPPAFRFGIACGGGPIVIARGVAARGIEHAVRRPRFRAWRQRQLAAHRNPDAIRGFGVYGASRAPGPAFVLDAVGPVRQRLWPVRDHLVRTESILAPAF